MSKYVIGGGLSGLIFAHYNPEYTVLTDSFGGFITHPIARKFVYLHETPATWDLVTSLNVDSFVKELDISYYDIDCLYDQPPDDFGNRYIRRKIPADWVPDNIELSAPGDEFRGIFVDENIIDVLAEEVTSKIGYVRSITEDHIEFSVSGFEQDSKQLEWDRIVSTVPATVFSKFCDVDWKLVSEPVTYAELETIPERYRERSWNLLYVIDEVPYHRVMKNMLSGKYYAEMRGEFEWTGPNDYVTHPTGVVKSEELDAPFEGIDFLGRFAEWDAEIRQDHVIEKARDGL